MNPLISIFMFTCILLCMNKTYGLQYLTNNQMGLIKTILRHPHKTDYMVNKISEILYQHYRYKAFDIAYEFRQHHYTQCKNIKFDELKLYASKGLLMAIKNYNPDYPFVHHMKLYVKGQLHMGVSDLHPLTILPKKIRLSKKWKKENRKTYMTLLKTTFVGNDDYLYERNSHRCGLQGSSEYSTFAAVWYIIHNLDIDYQRIMKYKYNFYMESIRSNSEVANLMCCSDECIRKKILFVKDKIKANLFTHFLKLTP